MLNLKRVAVTGGLSSGKSSVCRIFAELGAYVVSADEIVHQLLTPTTSLGQKVIKLLGNDIVVEGGKQIDRGKIASKVFINPELLESLENILHPAVRDEVEKEYQKIKKLGNAKLFVAEIPLLFEKGFGNYDATIAVISSAETSKKRFTNTTGYNPEEFDRRMSKQIPNEEKAQKAQYVINNEGSLDDLRRAVINIYNQLI